MFSQIQDLPLHPLAVHAAVILVPLATLMAILFVIPRTRSWAALPMAAGSVAALVAVFVARQSGISLKQTLQKLGGGQQWSNGPVGKAVAIHQGRANVLMVMMIFFAVIAVAVYFLWRRPDRFTGTLQYVACAVLVVGAVAVGFQTYRVGDAGSRALWNPDGNLDYGSASTVTSAR